MQVGSRIQALVDYIAPDEAERFDWGWFPLCGDTGVILNSFTTESGALAFDVKFDEDDLPNESWPYLASEIEEIDA